MHVPACKYVHMVVHLLLGLHPDVLLVEYAALCQFSQAMCEALWDAVRTNNAASVRALLRVGADPNLVDEVSRWHMHLHSVWCCKGYIFYRPVLHTG